MVENRENDWYNSLSLRYEMRLIVRRLVLNIAMSLDGFIARKDGSYDWIEGHGTDKYDTVLQFDNQKFFNNCDTVVMGRKSLEDCPLEMIEGYQEKQFIVASHTEQTDYGNVRFVRGTSSGRLWNFVLEKVEIFGCLVEQVWFRTV